MKPLNKTNQHLLELIQDLKNGAYKNGAPIWRDVADRLSRPSNNWAEVNLSRISRNVEKGAVVLVPGKLLGSGDINMAITVASYKASASAVEKVSKAGGRVITIRELMGENPKGTDVRIMG
ncbi:MAG: 50S ribosomal protein L18e [Candidatus Thermoplasmatota archaeon]|nr:50S ribosomal protein L18e [Candidatus Thermoplasmatota archaeon]